MRSLLGHLITALCAMMLVVGAWSTSTVAQDRVSEPHPAHLHQGPCADLDPKPLYPLTDVGPVSAEAMAGAIEISVTSLDVTLDALVTESFALNIHKSVETIEAYIACGDVTGTVVDGTLVIGLTETNGSGYAGVAILATAPAGGTDVTVYLGFALSDQAPGATPVAANLDTAETAVSILEYAFDTETIDIPVGTTVAWTNEGGVIHTTTSTEGLWYSGIMSSGDTFSYTFDDAGSFSYICSLHPSMIGKVVVSAP